MNRNWEYQTALGLTVYSSNAVKEGDIGQLLLNVSKHCKDLSVREVQIFINSTSLSMESLSKLYQSGFTTFAIKNTQFGVRNENKEALAEWATLNKQFPDAKWHFLHAAARTIRKAGLIEILKSGNIVSFEGIYNKDMASDLNEACATVDRKEPLPVYVAVKNRAGGEPERHFVGVVKFIKTGCKNLVFAGLHLDQYETEQCGDAPFMMLACCKDILKDEGVTDDYGLVGGNNWNPAVNTKQCSLLRLDATSGDLLKEPTGASGTRKRARPESEKAKEAKLVAASKPKKKAKGSDAMTPVAASPAASPVHAATATGQSGKAKIGRPKKLKASDDDYVPEPPTKKQRKGSININTSSTSSSSSRKQATEEADTPPPSPDEDSEYLLEEEASFGRQQPMQMQDTGAKKPKRSKFGRRGNNSSSSETNGLGHEDSDSSEGMDLTGDSKTAVQVQGGPLGKAKSRGPVEIKHVQQYLGFQFKQAVDQLRQMDIPSEASDASLIPQILSARYDELKRIVSEVSGFCTALTNKIVSERPEQKPVALETMQTGLYGFANSLCPTGCTQAKDLKEFQVASEKLVKLWATELRDRQQPVVQAKEINNKPASVLDRLELLTQNVTRYSQTRQALSELLERQSSQQQSQSQQATSTGSEPMQTDSNSTLPSGTAVSSPSSTSTPVTTEIIKAKHTELRQAAVAVRDTMHNLRLALEDLSAGISKLARMMCKIPLRVDQGSDALIACASCSLCSVVDPQTPFCIACSREAQQPSSDSQFPLAVFGSAPSIHVPSSFSTAPFSPPPVANSTSTSNSASTSVASGSAAAAAMTS